LRLLGIYITRDLCKKGGWQEGGKLASYSLRYRFEAFCGQESGRGDSGWVENIRYYRKIETSTELRTSDSRLGVNTSFAFGRTGFILSEFFELILVAKTLNLAYSKSSTIMPAGKTVTLHYGGGSLTMSLEENPVSASLT
jgi:hypothetical protein